MVEAQAAIEFARSGLQRYQQLVASGAVSQLQVEEKQAAVKIAEAQLTRARTALNPAAAAVAIAQEQITQEESRGRATVGKRQRAEGRRQRAEGQNKGYV